MTDLDIIKECRQTGKTRTTTKNLLEKAYYEQMTKKTNEPSGWNPVFEFPLDDRNTIIIDGVKYKRVEEPQSFYDKLWGLLKTKLGDTCGCDDMANKVMDLIRENIPEPYENLKFGVSEWFLGYNEALRRVNERLFE